VRASKDGLYEWALLGHLRREERTRQLSRNDAQGAAVEDLIDEQRLDTERFNLEIALRAMLAYLLLAGRPPGGAALSRNGAPRGAGSSLWPPPVPPNPAIGPFAAPVMPRHTLQA
jgi:hypothetical protein